MRKTLEIMDTTLRDGEQTSGVSFTVLEKLTLAKLLLQELKVDRIEIASARVSDGEFKAVKEIKGLKYIVFRVLHSIAPIFKIDVCFKPLFLGGFNTFTDILKMLLWSLFELKLQMI